MDDGWYHRDTIIWDKGSLGRKESTDNRCRHNFEVVLFFARIASGYWYNQDAVRLPLAGGQPYSVKGGYSQDHNKPGVLRRRWWIAISASRVIHWVASPTPCGISPQWYRRAPAIVPHFLKNWSAVSCC